MDEVICETRHGHVVMDEYEQSGERRVDVVGKTSFDRVLFVTFAPRAMDAARPVSARDATAKETALYEEHLRQRGGR
ncbi:MAG TPA: BrnT family toxin [Myxococcales bacterium]|nr:BrnT family toxin [Myxococcales bacterium]